MTVLEIFEKETNFIISEKVISICYISPRMCLFSIIIKKRFQFPFIQVQIQTCRNGLRY